MAQHSVTDLAAFVTARLDERAARAWAVHDVAKCDAMLYEEDMAGYAARTPDCDCGYPERVRRETAATRLILADHVHWRAESPVMPAGGGHETFGCERCLCHGWCLTVRALAAIDDGHPSYRAEWKS